MPKQKVEVIIDVHEPPEITGAVDAHPEVESYEFDDLDSADLVIAGIGFERKAPNDYVGSLKDGRLTEQTHKLGEQYEHAYILYEGALVETENPFKSSMNGSSVRGSMASLIARPESGVNAVIPCGNRELLVDMAIRVARKHIEESDQKYIPKPEVDFEADTSLMMYACIPGVGPEMAERLDERYPSVTKFIQNASFEDLQEIEGIGEERALKILDAFA